MRKRLLIGTLSGAALLVLTAALLAGWLLRRGGTVLGPPAERPPDPSAFSEDVFAVTWRALGGTDSRPATIGSARFFLSWAKVFVSSAPTPDAQRPEVLLPSLVSRSLVTGEYERSSQKHAGMRWQLDWMAGSFWLAGHWRSDELMAYYLSEAYFGHSVVGLEDAASTFFGVGSSQLDEIQLLSLLVVAEWPARFSLWCSPDAVSDRTSRFLEGSSSERLDTIERVLETVLQVPPGACPGRPTILEPEPTDVFDSAVETDRPPP